MENEIRKTVLAEIRQLQEELDRRKAVWEQMKKDHELKWARRRREASPYADTEEELEWEQRADIHEYRRCCIEPLEQQLKDKRESLKLFS